MSTDLAGAVITMIDASADPTERANAAVQVLTHCYGGGGVPTVWPGTRETLMMAAREIRALRQTLDNDVPGGTIIDEPTDKEPNHD